MNRAKKGFTKGLPWCVLIDKKMTDKAFEEEWWLKYKGHNKSCNNRREERNKRSEKKTKVGKRND
jgi:hypothetical protein